MNEFITGTASGILQIIVGALAIVFNKSFARRVIEFQIKRWGYNLGERHILAGRILIIAIGLFFFVFNGISQLFPNLS